MQDYSQSSNYLSLPVPERDLSPMRNTDDSFYSASPRMVQEITPRQTVQLVEQESIVENFPCSPEIIQDVVPNHVAPPVKLDSIFDNFPDVMLTSAIENLQSLGDGLTHLESRKNCNSSDLESYCADELIDLLKIDCESEKSKPVLPLGFSNFHQVQNNVDANIMVGCDIDEPLNYSEYGCVIPNFPATSSATSIKIPSRPIRRKRKITPLHAQTPPKDEEDQKRWHRAVKAHKHRESKEAQLQKMTEVVMHTQADLTATQNENQRLIELIRRYHDTHRRYQVDLVNITKERDNYRHQCEKMQDILSGCGSTVI